MLLCKLHYFLLGANPCDDKIPCEDGRCIPKQYCCIRSLDSNCPINNLVPCCTQYLEHLGLNYIHIKPSIIQKH
jgi:hypothetical protein